VDKGFLGSNQSNGGVCGSVCIYITAIFIILQWGIIKSRSSRIYNGDDIIVVAGYYYVCKDDKASASL
jgi:hypothetical protein